MDAIAQDLRLFPDPVIHRAPDGQAVAVAEKSLDPEQWVSHG
jgi:hypothetical protein